MDNNLKQMILESLDRNEVLKELNELHDELGVALETETLIKDEYTTMQKRMAELLCIIEYLEILQRGE